MISDNLLLNIVIFKFAMSNKQRAIGLKNASHAVEAGHPFTWIISDSFNSSNHPAGINKYYTSTLNKFHQHTYIIV